MGSGNVLGNVRHELYAIARASGASGKDAYKAAGYTGKTPHAHTSLERRPTIRRRIEEILKQTATQSELSRRDILDRIFQDWELARKLGQCASALKAGELLGREMHKMFTERKEIGGPGDFDNKSEEELKEILKKELHDLGWDEDIVTNFPIKGGSAIN